MTFKNEKMSCGVFFAHPKILARAKHEVFKHRGQARTTNNGKSGQARLRIRANIENCSCKVLQSLDFGDDRNFLAPNFQLSFNYFLFR